MNSELFKKNLSYIGTTDQELVERLLDSQSAPPRWTIVETRNQAWTLEGADDEGRFLSLHSKYNPHKEAAGLAATYQYSPTADLVFFGFGLGYHVAEVLKRESKHGSVVILEADIEVVRHACECIDLATVFGAHSVVWSVGEAPSSLFNRLTPASVSVLANSISILEHPASVRCFPAFYEQAKKTLHDFYTWARVNANTQIAKAKDFTRNVIANAPEIIKNPGIRHLFGAFSGTPVFIVSAGPSLDKNVHFLKEVQDRGIILCVDSALKTLLDHAIKPDLIVSIDFGKHNIKYLKDVPSHDLVLAFDPEVHPDIPKLFCGKKFVMNLPGKALCDWLTTKIGDKGCIPKGLSVAHSAFSLALELGASQIIFLGQDLSYPRGAWHSKGSGIFQKADISQEVQERMVDIDGYFGGQVKSETTFTVFLNQFESLLDGLSVACYNATEGGAKIHGVENITLRDAIKQFCVRPVDKSLLATVLPDEVWRRDFHIFFTAAQAVMEKLTDANHHAYTAFRSIEAMMDKVQRGDFSKSEIVSDYKRVIETIRTISNDEEVLTVIKDNAIEALIVRAKRELKGIEDVEFDDKSRICKELQKERIFFSTLVNACDFLSQQFCSILNDVKDSHLAYATQK